MVVGVGVERGMAVRCRGLGGRSMKMRSGMGMRRVGGGGAEGVRRVVGVRGGGIEGRERGRRGLGIEVSKYVDDGWWMGVCCSCLLLWVRGEVWIKVGGISLQALHVLFFNFFSLSSFYVSFIFFLVCVSMGLDGIGFILLLGRRPFLFHNSF